MCCDNDSVEISGYQLNTSNLTTPGTVREMLYEPPSLIVTPFLVRMLVSGGPPVVSPIRVKDGESAMNDRSTRDIELVLITPNPTRFQL